MFVIFTLTTIASLISIFVGWNKPEAFARKGKATPTRASICAASFGIFVLSSFLLFTSYVADRADAQRAAGAGIESRKDAGEVEIAKQLDAYNKAPLPHPSTSPQPTTNASDTLAAIQPAQPPKPVEPVSDWSYSDDEDSISGKSAHFAMTSSSNWLSFDFPYNGGSRGTLWLRKHPRQGTSVILQISKGQFVCGVENCSLMVRFDDGKPTRFNAAEPSDYSSTELFISPPARFIAAAKKAKNVVIEADYYQSGSQTLIFPIAGLKW